MRLGLVADIHNRAQELARAIELFREREVSQVVTLGDNCDAFSRDGADEVAALLDGCAAIGVWGNHDFTLCRDVPSVAMDLYPPIVLDVMSRMQPRVIVGDCHFSHKEASIDPHDMEQLWDIEETPLDLLARSRRAFEATTARLQFVGHYHRWWAATPAGPLPWSGAGRLAFEADERHFVVIAAVFEGWCAVLDTEQGWLEPLWCGLGATDR
jgi:predicted phosphodiesterase